MEDKQGDTHVLLSSRPHDSTSTAIDQCVGIPECGEVRL